MLYAMLSIFLLGLIVWGHHTYTVGLDVDTRAYFTIATSIIAIPTGIKIFTYIIGCRFSTMGINKLIIIGFIFLFTFGGFSGIILASPTIDIIFHDSYFVVGHFHYVLSLGSVFAVLGGYYHWFTFLTTLKYHCSLVRIQLFLFFIAANFTFLYSY